MENTCTEENWLKTELQVLIYISQTRFTCPVGTSFQLSPGRGEIQLTLFS